LKGWALLPPVKCSETILVVDDEISLCDLIADTLKPLGYKVMQASSGEEAMAFFNRGKVAIDLLVTDIVMPGMSGVELARCLRAKLVGLKVLFMSGYPAESIADHGIKLDEDHPFLQKPFAPDMLTGKVREILKAKASAS
jgi:DNA-binding response OmpR family regulator